MTHAAEFCQSSLLWASTGNLGMLWGAIGPDSATHIVQLQTVALVDSLMVGRTRSNPFCRDQVGILLGTMAGQGPSISPSTCGPLGGHWTRGIYGIEHPQGSDPVRADASHLTALPPALGPASGHANSQSLPWA